MFGGIERCVVFDRGVAVSGLLPEVALDGDTDGLPLRVEQHPHLGPVGIWSVHLEDDGDFSGGESDQRPRRVDADQLDEAPDQILVELATLVSFEHRQNPVRRKHAC